MDDDPDDDDGNDDTDDDSDSEAGGDDVDYDEAEAACERRLRQNGVTVPQRPLAREEAWALAHASEWSATIEDEF